MTADSLPLKTLTKPLPGIICGCLFSFLTTSCNQPVKSQVSPPTDSVTTVQPDTINQIPYRGEFPGLFVFGFKQVDSISLYGSTCSQHLTSSKDIESMIETFNQHRTVKEVYGNHPNSHQPDDMGDPIYQIKVFGGQEWITYVFYKKKDDKYERIYIQKTNTLEKQVRYYMLTYQSIQEVFCQNR